MVTTSRSANAAKKPSTKTANRKKSSTATPKATLRPGRREASIAESNQYRKVSYDAPACGNRRRTEEHVNENLFHDCEGCDDFSCLNNISTHDIARASDELIMNWHVAHKICGCDDICPKCQQPMRVYAENQEGDTGYNPSRNTRFIRKCNRRRPDGKHCSTKRTMSGALFPAPLPWRGALCIFRVLRRQVVPW